jgi:uncharacterized repeat protein (TIGR03803 family)
MYRLAGFFFVFVTILSLMALVGTAHAAKETVLYSFCAQAHCADGTYPNGSLTVVNGVLYGTTQSGGANYRCYVSDFDCGTIFSLNPQSDVETVVHSFDSTDGAFPLSGLVNLNGTLYGTTAEGGNYEYGCFEGGCGTVYSLNLANNAETVLYAFCSQQNCADGSIPDYGIANVGNVIYGTTQCGGSGCNYQDYSFGCGTVFSIDLETGAENVLYSFVCQEKESCVNGTDSETITSVGESLYGTTFQGGSGAYCLYRIPCGTVFSIDLDTGAETTLYSFCSQKKCTDGADPAPAVIDVNGILYGSTIGGGTHRRGGVFSLNPTASRRYSIHFANGKTVRMVPGPMAWFTSTACYTEQLVGVAPAPASTGASSTEGAV